MFRKIIMLVFSFLFFVCSFTESAKMKVAVLPFEDASLKKWWTWEWHVGSGVADMFVTSLFKIGRFSIIEREKIQKVLEEQKFGATGLVDTSTAAEIGKILGVKAIIVGKITEFSLDTTGGKTPDKLGILGGITVVQTTARCAIDARMIDTETAEILAAESAVGDKKLTGVAFSQGDLAGLAFGSANFENTILGQAIRECVDNLAKKFSETIGVTGEVIKVKTPELVYIDLTKEDGIDVGTVFKVQRPGEIIKTKKGIIKEMIDIGTITVTSVKEGYSEAVADSATVGKIQEGDIVISIPKPKKEEEKKKGKGVKLW